MINKSLHMKSDRLGRGSYRTVDQGAFFTAARIAISVRPSVNSSLYKDEHSTGLQYPPLVPGTMMKFAN
jgi:hypothetical protein